MINIYCYLFIFILLHFWVREVDMKNKMPQAQNIHSGTLQVKR